MDNPLLTSGKRATLSAGLRWCSVGLIAVVALLLFIGVFKLRHLDSLNGAFNDAFYADLENLKAGRTDALHLYCTKGTDALVTEIGGMTGVNELALELTDVTDGGMAAVASLPNLRVLVLYGGRPGVGNEGLARLHTCTRLKRLELINTRVTDDGLAILLDFPELRSLTLYHDAFRESTLTDAGLLKVKDLGSLKSLDLTGGWITDAGLAHLVAMRSLQSISLDGGTRVTDAGLEHLAGMTALEHLLLRETAVTDAGLAHLSGLTRLKALALSGTRVTDTGLRQLRGLPELKELYIASPGAHVTDAGLADLKEALPELRIYR